MSDQQSGSGGGQGPGGEFVAGGKGRRGGNRAGAGAGGVCVCPRCGAKLPHQRGAPCFQAVCTECGAAMRRG